MMLKKRILNNLHVHSHYSSLDAVAKVEDVVSFAVENKLTCACLTEHGCLSSAYVLWEECRKNNIKPIIGIEAYYVDKIGKDEFNEPYCYSHVCLYCKNEIGWNNLKEIQFLAWRDGFYKKPCVDFDMLKKHSEGLIVSTACVAGVFNAPILGNAYFNLLSQRERKKVLRRRIKNFMVQFKDDLYLEIMLNDLVDQKKANKNILKIAEEYGIKTIVTNDCHYVYEEDSDSHDVLKCIAFRKTIAEEDNGTYDTNLLYLVTPEDLDGLRKKYHKYIKQSFLNQCMKNTVEIESKVENFPIRTEKSALPKYSKNSKNELKKLCLAGKRKLFGKKWTEKHQKRLEEELSVINKLGMADYFLIVWDIANETRNRDIPFNTRGSVAGSLVAYLMGISWVDPIKFNTNFERFLTEDRISLPDIDMDFGKRGRDELIGYLKNKYGEDSVANIINFSIFKPRSYIKDVSRVYGLPFGTVNKVTKIIPDNTSDWKDAIKIPEVCQFVGKHEEIENNSKNLLGISRHRGVHASGVVVTPGRILDWVPIAWSIVGDENKKQRVTEFDTYALEDLNILKLDFLGQNTLDIIKHTLDLINDEKLKSFSDFMRMILNNLNDKEVYRMIRTGDLIGTFQMGTSSGMRELIVRMKPRKIEDVIISIALHRTAILKIGAHEKYIKRKFGKEEITYYHPKMARVLDETNGIMLFQESIGEISVHLAGFTRTEADNFRKGIKQKDIKKFDKWKDKFISGCKQHSNIRTAISRKIWNEMLEWSSYGFNKSHATSYGLISYATAWLKHHYPAEFFTSLLTHNVDDDNKLTVYLREAKGLGLKFIRPSINYSTYDFEYRKNKIFYPLSVIKNVGEKAITNILEVRKKDGKFISFNDFLQRVNHRVVNSRVVNALILSGCFKKFEKINKLYNEFNETVDKSVIRDIYCNVCKKKYPISFIHKNKIADASIVCPECGDVNIVTNSELIKKKDFNYTYLNKMVFGFSFGDILKNYLGKFIKYDAYKLSNTNEVVDGDIINIGFMVKDIKKWKDKNDNEMAFIRCTDGFVDGDLVVFASQWEVDQGKLKKGNVVIGKNITKDDELKFVITRGTKFIKL